MTHRGNAAAPPLLSEEAVAAYLHAHPDFFQRHEGLLARLQLPHARRGAVSLVERQIELLRARQQAAERKLLELVKIARENEELSGRLHRFSMALIECDTLDDVLATARDQMLQTFRTDFVNLSLFTRLARASSLHDVSLEETRQLFPRPFENGRPQCGGMTAEQLQYLFGADAAEVGSAAFVPLQGLQPVGFLALGSYRKERFYPGMGTLFLGYLGEALARAIQHHDRPAA